MKFTLTIELGNDAMQKRSHVAKSVATRKASGSATSTLCPAPHRQLRDARGFDFEWRQSAFWSKVDMPSGLGDVGR